MSGDLEQFKVAVASEKECSVVFLEKITQKSFAPLYTHGKTALALGLAYFRVATAEGAGSSFIREPKLRSTIMILRPWSGDTVAI